MPRPIHRSADKVLGKLIKQHRQRAQLSQTALGKLLGVSFQQIQKYEKGKNRISADSLFKIAKHLQISVSELLSSDRTENKSGAKAQILRFSRSREGRQFILDFLAIESHAVRVQIRDLTKALSRRIEG
jgi:transcriptional regulator with XRE-family HTH domain